MMEIVDVYEQAFRMFFENLKKEGLETGVLVFRLDFSEYFAMKEIEYRAWWERSKVKEMIFGLILVTIKFIIFIGIDWVNKLI